MHHFLFYLFFGKFILYTFQRGKWVSVFLVKLWEFTSFLCLQLRVKGSSMKVIRIRISERHRWSYERGVSFGDRVNLYSIFEKFHQFHLNDNRLNLSLFTQSGHGSRVNIHSVFGKTVQLNNGEKNRNVLQCERFSPLDE